MKKFLVFLTLSLLCAISFTFVGGDHSNRYLNDFEDALEDAEDDIKEAGKDAEDDVKESLKDAEDDVKEAGEDAEDDVKKTLEDAEDDVKEAAEDAEDDLKQLLSKDGVLHDVFEDLLTEDIASKILLLLEILGIVSKPVAIAAQFLIGIAGSELMKVGDTGLNFDPVKEMLVDPDSGEFLGDFGLKQLVKVLSRTKGLRKVLGM